MNIFEFRDRLIGDYASYIESFIQIRDPHIHDFVEGQLQQGMLWPDPLITLAKKMRALAFESGNRSSRNE